MDTTNAFATGANLVMREKQLHQQKKNQEQQRALRDEQMRMARKAEERQQQAFKAQQEALATQREYTQAQFDEFQANKENRQTLADTNVKNAQQQSTLNQQNIDANKKAAEQADKAQQLKDNTLWLQQNFEPEMYRIDQGRGISAEFYQRSQGTPYDFNKAIDPVYGQALNFVAAGLDPDDNRVTPLDNRTIPALNKIFSDEINKNLEGSAHPITGSAAIDKKIVGVRPVMDDDGNQLPGKYYLDLEITYTDGTTRTEPMTEGRDNNPDAPLKPIELGALVEQVGARQAWYNAMQVPEIQDEIKKYAAFTQRTKGSKDAYNWNGVNVTPKELQTQFENNEAQYANVTVLTDNGEQTFALYGLEDYAMTQGDPDKLAALRQAAEHNRQQYQLSVKSGKRMEWLDWKLLYAQQERQRQASAKQNAKSGNDKPARPVINDSDVFAAILGEMNQGAQASQQPSTSATPDAPPAQPPARTQSTLADFANDSNFVNWANGQ